MAMRSGCMRKMCRGSTKPRCSQQGNVFSQLRQQLRFHPRWHHCKPETSMRYQHQSVLTNNRRCTTLDSTLHSRVPRNMRSAPNPVQDPQDIKAGKNLAKDGLCHLYRQFSTLTPPLQPTGFKWWLLNWRCQASPFISFSLNLEPGHFWKTRKRFGSTATQDFLLAIFFAQGTQFVELLAVAFWPPRTLR